MKGVKDRVAATGQLLVRSGIEIGRTLQAICESGTALSAALESGELLFLSRLLKVDAEAGFMLIACSDVKHANSALMNARTVLFACTHNDVRYEFASGNARETVHEGVPAIRLVMPPAVLALQRREKSRTRLSGRAAIICVVQVGPLSFEAQVADISAEGLGAIVYEPGIRIEPGSRLEKVKIVMPGQKNLEVDLEVRHVAKVPNIGGRWVMRAGCSFVAAPAELEQMLRLFLAEIGPD